MKTGDESLRENVHQRVESLRILAALFRQLLGKRCGFCLIAFPKRKARVLLFQDAGEQSDKMRERLPSPKWTQTFCLCGSSVFSCLREPSSTSARLIWQTNITYKHGKILPARKTISPLCASLLSLQSGERRFCKDGSSGWIFLIRFRPSWPARCRPAGFVVLTKLPFASLQMSMLGLAGISQGLM